MLKPKEVKTMNCPHCNADLTKPESVTRWYAYSAHYTPDGDIDDESEKEADGTRTTCDSCGQEL